MKTIIKCLAIPLICVGCTEEPEEVDEPQLSEPIFLACTMNSDPENAMYYRVNAAEGELSSLGSDMFGLSVGPSDCEREEAFCAFTDDSYFLSVEGSHTVDINRKTGGIRWTSEYTEPDIGRCEKIADPLANKF